MIPILNKLLFVFPNNETVNYNQYTQNGGFVSSAVRASRSTSHDYVENNNRKYFFVRDKNQKAEKAWRTSEL
jgi:hypothetical protein